MTLKRSGGRVCARHARYRRDLRAILVRGPALFLVSVSVLGAQGSPPPESRAVRLTGTIRLDGKLDEAAWGGAPVTDAFTQVDPDEA